MENKPSQLPSPLRRLFLNLNLPLNDEAERLFKCLNIKVLKPHFPIPDNVVFVETSLHPMELFGIKIGGEQELEEYLIWNTRSENVYCKFTEKSITMNGNSYVQCVSCCKQPNGGYSVGLTWNVVGTMWRSYSPNDLPPTLDQGMDYRRYEGRRWRAARMYGNALCEKYNLDLIVSI